jgi:hypothetical protein
MATLDDLSAALVNAHGAGDVDAARTLAAEITKMQQPSTPQSGPVTLGDVGRSALNDVKKFGSKLYDTVTQTPMRAFEESARARMGLDYNIGPIIDGAMMGSPLAPRAGPAVPNTPEALKIAGRNQYESPAVKDVRISPQGMSRLSDEAVAAMEAKGARQFSDGNLYKSVE